MDNIIRYKDYFAKIEYSAQDGILYGKIEGINDLVTFESDNIQNIYIEFVAAVDDYLDFCKKNNKAPEKPYKGSFNVRISPALHKQIAQMAILQSKSLNELVENAIESYVQSPTNIFNMTKFINNINAFTQLQEDTSLYEINQQYSLTASINN